MNAQHRATGSSPSASPSPTSQHGQPEQHGQPAPLIIRTAGDVNRVLGLYGSQGTKTKAIILLALGGIFMDAYDFSSIAFGITAIKAEFGLNGFMTGFVNAAIMIGAVAGAVFGGYLVDRFGRYKLFMADMVFFVVAAVGCALAWDAWSLIGFRFIMGIGVGLDLPVAMAFLAEFSKLAGRGNRSQRVNAWSPAWYIATGTGYLIVLIVFLLLPMEQHAILWRIVVGFGAVPALIVLLVRRRYMAESPQWLADNGDVSSAVDIMRSHHALDVVYEAPEAQQGRAGRARWANFAELFSPRYRKRTILALCVSVFSTFGYNAVAYGTPLIITTLFHQGPLVTIMASLIINLCFGALGGLLGMSIVNRFGTRAVTGTGFAIQAAALIVLAAVGIPAGGLVVVSIAMLAAFIFAQAGGPGANLMNYATLSYPSRLRGIGVGFNQAVLRTFSIVSLIAFPMLAASLSTGVFWIVACAPLAGAIAVALIRWDPTGVDVDAEDRAAA
ncbi:MULTISPECIES: MFS transporter [Brevibacterium]|uniref:MFS transporter n=1 Tax=Brevibacterium TaxID=1696 RepID=UPI0022810F40|nr:MULTISPECIES: MFS transporter [Brevibacterium]WAL39300.1 MFS transporter [Brevibacterium sp. BRM-1]